MVRAETEVMDILCKTVNIVILSRLSVATLLGCALATHVNHVCHELKELIFVDYHMAKC